MTFLLVKNLLCLFNLRFPRTASVRCHFPKRQDCVMWRQKPALSYLLLFVSYCAANSSLQQYFPSFPICIYRLVMWCILFWQALIIHSVINQSDSDRPNMNERRSCLFSLHWHCSSSGMLFLTLCISPFSTAGMKTLAVLPRWTRPLAAPDAAVTIKHFIFWQLKRSHRGLKCMNDGT